MEQQLNETHDPGRRSWVESANASGCDFPIQNLPFGVFFRDGEPHGGVAIGDQIVDLRAAMEAGLFAGNAATAARAAAGSQLNPMMALGNAYASALRARLSDLLRVDGADSARARRLAGKLLVPMRDATMALPCRINDYTDFLTSAHHAERHGRYKGLKDPLPAAFKYLPVAYHGRASSIRVSGTPVIRPNGQWKASDHSVQFGPVEALDFELELGAFVGPGNELGTPIPIKEARQHVFGYCLLNDWSAKSVQWWEQVLGPFLGKSFMTSVSPWVVTEEALAPFRAPAPLRGAGDPAPLPYLHSEKDQREGSFDLELEASLWTETMRRRGTGPVRVTRTHLRYMYWTFTQMVTHHASNGCNLQPGDLIGSGTISGPADESRACMTELTNGGVDALALGDGETRMWLRDGDEVILTARAERAGWVPIGFGQCRGRVEQARPWPP
jgi:fumarylacetoacetase